MGECLRRTCPCLQSLWDRLFKRRDDVGSKGETGCAEDGLNSKLENNTHPVTRYGPASVHEPVDMAVYTALWAFEARADEELSFEVGDMFKIVSKNGDWWTAQKLDSCGRTLATGIVPYNYLERGETVATQPWFFGKMNRFESLSHLLSAENGDGAFLVRLSENDSVGHVLSVRVRNGAKHFKVYQTGSVFYVDQAHGFPSLLELVEYYHNHRLGAVQRLGKPCIRRQPQPQDLSHTTVDDWELPKEDFTLEEKLGSGQFADVYRGKWKRRINVAIKILKNNESLNQQDFQMEVQLLKRMRHRNLISLFAICTSSTPYYIITELMEKGNLLDVLRSAEGEALDLMSMIDMAAQVADGMVYLEDHNSIHRDLAARNVLVGEGYVCKVADFGLARIIKEAVYISTEKKIPYKWTAPEAISRGRYSNKSDVWSFGVLLYEIVTNGGVPYPGFTTNEAVKQVMHHGYRMPAPPNCPQCIYDIMLSCWSDKPENRPDFKQLKSDLENMNRYTELE
ncbi:protein-tyrosine kinase 6b [Electrophorus electricus]|uniref:Tyrosine-protein kinase n=1 Tax=Electrophorus electricus TaxID=8005 RepID=A0A4W4EQ83_ELEEL|nr:protein-tyrosine kinase 6b [Electrophorus electricus]